MHKGFDDFLKELKEYRQEKQKEEVIPPRPAFERSKTDYGSWKRKS